MNKIPNEAASDVTQAEMVKHAQSDIAYVDGLEACLDEGQYGGAKNVRDLIAMVRWNANAHINAIAATRKHDPSALVEALREIIADCDADYPPSHGAIKYFAKTALAAWEASQ